MPSSQPTSSRAETFSTGGLGDPGGAQPAAATVGFQVNLYPDVVHHAVFGGIAVLQGFDELIPVDHHRWGRHHPRRPQPCRPCPCCGACADRPHPPRRVIVGRVVTAQEEVGGGRNEKTGDVLAAGQAIERFSLQPLASACKGLEHPLGGLDQLQFQGGHQLGAHLG